MNKRALTMILALVMVVSMLPFSVFADDSCTFGQHDQLMELGITCPICKKDPNAVPDEPEEEPDCTFGQHDQLMELGIKCPICKKDPNAVPDEPEEEPGCTFGQHDQMIELGCICPICGECGHTFVEGTCLWCFAEEKTEESGCTFGQHDQMIDLGCICPICGECGHTYEEGFCKYCGEKSPFETSPDQPDADEEKKCTFGQHDQMIDLGCICPICGECGHTFVEGTCLWCFAEEKSDESGCTFGQHDQMIELGCICPICGECGHTYEEGVCKYCGEKSPFETAPEQPDADEDKKCTFGQHDQMIELGCICPICGECGHTYEEGFCKYCGEKTPFETAPKCEHPSGVSIDQEIFEPTCMEDGFILTIKVCNECGKEYEITSPLGKATGHKYVNGQCACGAKAPVCKHPSGVAYAQEIFEATCEEDGYILTKMTCNTCGKNFEKVSPLGKATNHNWKKTVTEATCVKPGNEHYACENCGDFYDVAIPAAGHDYVNGKCACGASDPAVEEVPPVEDRPIYRPIYTWDFQDVFLVG